MGDNDLAPDMNDPEVNRLLELYGDPDPTDDLPL